MENPISILRAWRDEIDTFAFPNDVRPRTFDAMAAWMDYIWAIEAHVGQPLTPKQRRCLAACVTTLKRRKAC